MRPLLADLDADAVARAVDAFARSRWSRTRRGDGVVFDSRAWIVTAFR